MSTRQDRDEEGRPVTTHISNVKKAVAGAHEAIKRANDGQDVDFVMHDLRRTAASYMASMGIQRLVISKILNYVESGVTAVYERHSYDAEKRQVLNVWAERLEIILSKDEYQSS